MDFLEYVDSDDAKGLPKSKVKIIAVAAVCCLVLCAVAYFAFFGTAQGGLEVTKADSSSESSSLSEQGIESQANSTDSETILVCVDVAGAVNSPGVVYIASDSRVADAIVAAGGAKEDAALSQINQARVVSDGEQIYVPSTAELESAPASSSSSTPSNSVSSSSASLNDGKVNINTADSATLQTISGIGESKAEKIIAYRNANGNFKSVDELVNVSGIGEKTLESIRDKICV
jgi:competence protein ComEA